MVDGTDHAAVHLAPDLDVKVLGEEAVLGGHFIDRLAHCLFPFLCDLQLVEVTIL
jgi:hypothetical protein